MSMLEWDKIGEHYYETGTDRGVLYIQEAGAYPKGEAWSGLTAVNENPSGADASDLYADNAKYLSLRSAETFGCTIEAYQYPPSFGVCDGTAEIAKGVTVGQQTRKSFGFSYRTKVGNDTEGEDLGYKIHLVYGATAAPSSKNYSSTNDNPEAITFSWEVSTTPVNVKGLKPTATVEIDSRYADAEKLKALEAILYGSESSEARLPLPDEVATLMAVGAAG